MQSVELYAAAVDDSAARYMVPYFFLQNKVGDNTKICVVSISDGRRRVISSYLRTQFGQPNCLGLPRALYFLRDGSLYILRQKESTCTVAGPVVSVPGWANKH